MAGTLGITRKIMILGGISASHHSADRQGRAGLSETEHITVVKQKDPSVQTEGTDRERARNPTRINTFEMHRTPLPRLYRTLPLGTSTLALISFLLPCEGMQSAKWSLIQRVDAARWCSTRDAVPTSSVSRWLDLCQSHQKDGDGIYGMVGPLDTSRSQ